ncbi:hypothetical protein [Curtobacterium sp. YR515]|uniref:hypothetical protein n=1 Tax=Curtobacterium sp. YR515 TaxID=1855316 RepID=UPI0008E32A2A|nr:hypothetical protein [Curtobacterium sp. YR515]SFF50236.1 hypothetical protein SAMN05216329_1023 [Curtobacterium sp. YR515]
MEQQKHPTTTGRRCAGGAIAVAVLAGLVALPATPATAAEPSTSASQAAERATQQDTTAALAVTHGLEYAPGDRLGLTGTAAPNADVTITGIPRKGGTIDRPVTVRSDQSGKWIVFTVPGSALAESYDLAVASGGASIDVTTRATDGYRLAERELTIPAEQRFVRGETLTLTGTADAYTSVAVLGLPGWKPGQPGTGTTADENGDWSITSEEPAFGALLLEARGQGLGQSRWVQERVEQEARPGEFEAFTIEEGLVYAPGSRLVLVGEALPGSIITVDGLPEQHGGSGSGTTRRVTADDDGTWQLVTLHGSATADRYDLTFTVGGSSRSERATADESFVPVQRDVTVTEGQTYVRGEVATVTGTADAYTSVRVDGLPGRTLGYGVVADRNGNWTATSADPVTNVFEVRVQGQQHGTVSPVVTAVIDQAPREGEFEAFTIERGLTYVPDGTVGLSGTALPFSRIAVDGLPSASGPSKTNWVVADVDGAWAIASSDRAATADRYDLTFTVAGSAVTRTVTADPDLDVVEHDLAFASGQSFVVGERATIRGTSDAFAVVHFRGLPGDPSNGKIVIADADGNWVATSGEPITGRTPIIVSGFGGGEYRSLQATIVPSERPQTPPVTVATTTFVKGKKQLIEGTAAPKAKVNIYSGSKYLMHVIAGADGKWSYTTGGVINTDTFTRTLKSEGAKDVTFTLTAAEQEQTAPITVATTSFVKGEKQRIEGAAAPKARVDVYSGSKYLMHVIAGADGKWSYTTGAVINDDTFTRTLKSAGTKDVTFTLHAR